MRTTLLIALFTVASVSTADAHIELLSPTARYTIAESGDNKACPCGLGDSNRLCNIPEDRSDPNRSDRVTTLTAGGTVTVRFSEYVGHSGRYRVAIDFDGADLDDFNDNILLDVPDPPGSAGNTGDGSIWEFEVQLPDMECDNCTLQLIQMMDGNTTDPVPDPVGRSSYYTCADIILAGGNGGPDAGPGVDAADGGGNGDDDGCGCRTVSPSSGWPVLGVLLMLAWRNRKRNRLV